MQVPNLFMYWVLFRSEKKKKYILKTKNVLLSLLFVHMQHWGCEEQCFVLESVMWLSGIRHAGQETTVKFKLEAFSLTHNSYVSQETKGITVWARKKKKKLTYNSHDFEQAQKRSWRLLEFGLQWLWLQRCAVTKSTFVESHESSCNLFY